MKKITKGIRNVHFASSSLLSAQDQTLTLTLKLFLSVPSSTDGCVLCLSPEGVTWGKVVSLYAVAGALAVDCVRHGHPAMVHTIVDCMGEFVRKSLTSWLKRRGGWVRIAIQR